VQANGVPAERGPSRIDQLANRAPGQCILRFLFETHQQITIVMRSAFREIDQKQSLHFAFRTSNSRIHICGPCEDYSKVHGS
jgi:hypothetical protein